MELIPVLVHFKTIPIYNTEIRWGFSGENNTIRTWSKAKHCILGENGFFSFENEFNDLFSIKMKSFELVRCTFDMKTFHFLKRWERIFTTFSRIFSYSQLFSTSWQDFDVFVHFHCFYSDSWGIFGLLSILMEICVIFEQWKNISKFIEELVFNNF